MRLCLPFVFNCRYLRSIKEGGSGKKIVAKSRTKKTIDGLLLNNEDKMNKYIERGEEGQRERESV